MDNLKFSVYFSRIDFRMKGFKEKRIVAVNENPSLTVNVKYDSNFEVNESLDSLAKSLVKNCVDNYSGLNFGISLSFPQDHETYLSNQNIIKDFPLDNSG